jgi:hypothetical protein
VATDERDHRPGPGEGGQESKEWHVDRRHVDCQDQDRAAVAPVTQGPTSGGNRGQRSASGRVILHGIQGTPPGPHLEHRVADLGQRGRGPVGQPYASDHQVGLVPAHPPADGAGEQEPGDLGHG